MKLRLLTEWIYAEDRDSELYDKISKIRFKILAKSSISVEDFDRFLDELEPLIYKIPIDKDGNEQQQKNHIQELAQEILIAKRFSHIDQHTIIRFATNFGKQLSALMRDERDAHRNDY
jgi:hypothetical protein